MSILQPETDLSLSKIVVGVDIINILQNSKGYMIVEDLLGKFLEQDKKRDHNLFFDTLTFLYCLGILKENKYKIRLKNAFTQKTLF